jgi:fimbrial chaperone protein
VNEHHGPRGAATVRPSLRSCAALLLMAAACIARAGEFSVSPLRVDLKASHRLEVLTVTNSADAPLAVQLRLVSWSQDNGEDQYVDTQDLLATPPIFRIAPRGQQIIRVALRHDPDPSRETDYRVFVTEIPQPPSKDFSGMQVALRMSLPIFVAPAAPENPELHWSAQWSSDGAVRITASNTGNAHVKVTDFDVRFAGTDKPSQVNVTRYVLPGSSVSWTVKPDAEAGIDREAAIHLRGTTDRGDFAAAVAPAGT